jgi:3-phenylpropionate/trans-cinnamate dioxygenase ferredoxin reductase subunit/anthranilate 1,2-dioxygenase ferredoxin reductase subunit
MQRFVVVGGGVAGHRAVIELSRRAPNATIDLVSEEPCLPYDRPPVSKELLHGSKTAEEIVLTGASVYAQTNIRYHAGARVTAIDRVHRKVMTQGGAEFVFDRLLLATGSRPRQLPPDCVGEVAVRYLRTVQDALALQQQLIAGRRVAVIGGGFIGLEVAAAAVRRGCRVTIIESQARVLARGMPILVSEWVDRLHRAEGVEICLSASVIAMRQERSNVSIIGSGWTTETDLVVVGIGAEPNVELAADAGLEVCDGLVVDAQCRTSDAAIYGAGEVTCHPMMHGVPRRVESWKSSSEQGTVAAQAMTGAAVLFDEVPTLWSDQFNANIQAVGFPDLGVEHEVIGDPASNSWTLVSLGRDGSVVGGVAINRGRDASALRRAVRNRASLASMQPKVA